MNESDARSRARTEYRSASAPRARRQLLPWLLMVAVLAATPVLGTSAWAGSGGTSASRDGGGKYARLWDGISRKNKRWAHRTSECESGGNAKIHGGGGTYHGAFQFMLSTWRNAPKSPGGDPHERNWRTQAVVAVYLKKRDGTGHWPNCG